MISRPATVRAAARKRTANNRQLAAMLLPQLVRSSLDPRRRRQLARHIWIELKRYAAPGVVAVDLAEIPGVEDLTVEGPVWRHDPLILAAIARIVDARAIFEFGTFLGETAWLLAHNAPRAHVHTLDLPGPQALEELRYQPTDPEYFEDWTRATRFAGTPEESRITRLYGDSATFDFSPYRGRMDLVYIDASHSYDYVRSDSEAALSMLSPEGTIVWDDYTYYPGVYRFLNELAEGGTPVYHVLGTRLCVHTGGRLFTRPGVPDYRRNWP
jgi:predicted O-methyltransferase YrrM